MLCQARDHYATLALEFPSVPEYRYRLALSHVYLGFCSKTWGIGSKPGRRIALPSASARNWSANSPARNTAISLAGAV